MEEEEECPFCGEKMEKGFVIGGRGIFWWPDKPLPGSWLGHIGEKIASSAEMSWRTTSHLPAHRCVRCKIILIHAPEMEVCGS